MSRARGGGERRRRLEQERPRRRRRDGEDRAASARAAPAPAAPAASVLPSGPAPPRRPGRLAPVAVAVVVLLVVTGVLLWRAGDDGADPGASGAVTPGGAATSTAVVAVQDGGRVTGASLLAVGPDQTSALLVPSRLVVDVAGSGRGALADSVAVSAGAPGTAIADVLDVRVDGTWLLDGAGLAELVDALGGVVVDVDVAVPADDAAVAPGPGQRLGGAEAAALATFRGEGEADAVRLARQERVLSAVLAALPREPAEVRRLLGSLGEGSTSTLDDGALAELLARVARHQSQGAYGATVLPVDEIATGGDEVLYGLDDAAAAEVLSSRFAAVQREGAGDAVRVLVQNGVGTPGLGDAARTRLVEAGFRFLGGGNAGALGRETSTVLVPSGSAADRTAGMRVAEALGLPEEAVAVGQEAPTTADVVVVLGADFAQVADGGG